MSVSAASPQSSGQGSVQRRLVLHGIGVARGIVIARALVFQHQETPVFRVPLLRAEVGDELARFEAAKELTKRELEEIRARTEEALGEDHGYIFDAHSLMLEDPMVAGRIEEVIREERVNAEWAAQRILDELSSVFDDLEDDYFRARRSDIHDVIARLMRNLAGAPTRTLEKIGRKCILVSDDVRPSDIVRLDWNHLAGLAMEAGSRTYHTAIIARSMGIPCVVGVRDLTSKIDHGAPLVLDGGEGVVVVNPDRATLRVYRSRRKREELLKQKLGHLRDLPAETKDGYRIVLQANVEFPEECAAAQNQGASGIGLFRSEWFLTRNRGQFPTEDAQYRVYRAMAEQMKPWSVIVRAFDLSADQVGEEMGRPEANPALGLRAIRLLLKRRDLFKEQLRALLRSRRHGNVKVMFPMVSGVGELREALAVVEEAKEELRRQGIDFAPDLPCGVTLEVPSAAATADLLAREAAFFSIGTNDLIQYLIGVDRSNDQVSYLYEPLHPAMLRTLRFVIDSAHGAGIKVGMCGEMASDPMLVALLVGFGLDELSMNADSVPTVKNIIRNLSAEEAKAVAAETLHLPTVKDVSRFLDEKFRRLLPGWR